MRKSLIMILSVRSGSSTTAAQSNGEIIREGVLKKLKTSKKKYFVLKAETAECLARLEYYDNERKFRSGIAPKRSIPLKACFNINKRTDTKYTHVIALYTKDDCFGIVLDSEDELNEWLEDLLRLQNGINETPIGEQPRPDSDKTYEYVWKVKLCERGLGYGRIGPYNLCLAEQTLTLLEDVEKDPVIIEVPLASIRGCGNLRNFFFMEIGRSHCMGPGEIWTDPEDVTLAFNIHTTVSHRFRMYKAQILKNNLRNQLSDNPDGRLRAASATEPSDSSGKAQNNDKQVSDSSTSTVQGAKSTANSIKLSVSSIAVKLNNLLLRASSKRRHSISGANWTANIYHQRTQSLPVENPTIAPIAPLTNDHSSLPATDQSANATSSAACAENQSASTLCADGQSAVTSQVINQSQTSSSTCGQFISVSKKGGQNSKSLRERCDSMPTRPRNGIESTQHGIPSFKSYLIPHRNHARDASHSSPTGSPMSPPSDSSTFNHVPENHEAYTEMEPQMNHQRMHYPLSPSDVSIAEEEENPKSNVSNSNTFPDNNNSYVLMGNNNLHNGYADMSMSPNTGGHHVVSDTASISSIASGTPSTDMRFHDYQSRLDKVVSYVATEDDDEDENRSGRAYSVGSKSSVPAIQQAKNAESSRMRAFSVGSKQTQKQVRVLPPSHQPPHGVKSNSAPMLSYSRQASSYGSIGPMDDLMELDFSSEAIRSRTNTNASGGSNDNKHKSVSKKMFGYLMESLTGHNKTPPGYVEMNPSTKKAEVSAYVDMTQGQRSSPSDYSYMDMSAGLPAKNGSKDQSAYMDMSGTSPAKNQSSQPADVLTNKHNDYVDMDQSRKRTSSNNSTASSTRIGTSPGYRWNADYLDMTGKNHRNSFSSQMSSSPQHLDVILPQRNDWHFGPQSSRLRSQNDHLEGYVDMTPGNGHQRQSSLDGNNPVSEDYMSMSGGSAQKKERSQPIAIRTTSNNQAMKNSSPITISSLLSGRKLSPTNGSPPKLHLPLTSYTTSSPYSSLPRTKAKNDSSKDSSSSSVTTPSSSSTMFPLSLNSPSSPGSSKTNKTTAKPATKLPLFPAHNIGRRSSDDYAMMDFESKPPRVIENDVYVNYHPGDVKISQDNSSDYTIMKPGASTTQKSTTLPRARSSRPAMGSPIVGHFTNMDSKDGRGFKPITEKDERVASPKPNEKVSTKKTQDQTVNSSSYVCMTPLNQRSGSRNSIASTSSATSVGRPCRSETSTPRLHYASLDLTMNDEGESKSPRTLNKEGGSSGGGEPSVTQTTTFVYADIDFVKSEDLKKSSANKCSSSISPGLGSSTVIKP